MNGFFIQTSKGKKGPFSVEDIGRFHAQGKIPATLDVYEAESGLAFSVQDIIGPQEELGVLPIVEEPPPPPEPPRAPRRASQRRSEPAGVSVGRPTASVNRAPKRGGLHVRGAAAGTPRRPGLGVFMLIVALIMVPWPALKGILILIIIAGVEVDPEAYAYLVGMAVGSFICAGIGVFCGYYGIRFLRGPREVGLPPVPRRTAGRKRRARAR